MDTSARAVRAAAAAAARSGRRCRRGSRSSPSCGSPRICPPSAASCACSSARMSPVESFGARIDESRVRRRSRSISNHVRRRVNALRLLRVAPRPQRELEDEELAGLGEDDGRLGAHHHVLAAVELRLDLVLELHDALDARQRQLELADVDGRRLTEGLGRLLEEAGDEGVVHGAPRTARSCLGRRARARVRLL